MRTTLDIDDDVLNAARELARLQKTTAGHVISDLARKALTGAAAPSGSAGSHGTVLRNGWYVLPRRGGPVVTNELVQRLLDKADLEDAGLGGDD